MHRYIISFGFVLLSLTGLAQKNAAYNLISTSEITRIVSALSADDMQGRNSLSPHIAKAADFIAAGFKEIGLIPYAEENYRQSFVMQKISKESQRVIYNTQQLKKTQYLIIGDTDALQWDEKSSIKTYYIHKSDDFASKFREYVTGQEDAIIIVDPSFESFIARYAKIYDKERVLPKTQNNSTTATKTFIVATQEPKSFLIEARNNITEIPLFNVAGIIPGQSKPEEYVIFSAHYDHIGILSPDGQDSIANGADDDASGTTAVISLAKYYKELNNNARTLIFIAFTAEEIGMFGSKYFSNAIDAEKVAAMINIEMIGKDSKFGQNTLYVTGYDASDLGALMQSNLRGSSFKFYPDPYTKQNLFYRSDNAVLAALGVPAHTFSTSQIDKDSYYHTVKDDISTLNIQNIKSSIEAIAIGAKGIVDGSQTPSRVEKLQ